MKTVAVPVASRVSGWMDVGGGVPVAEYRDSGFFRGAGCEGDVFQALANCLGSPAAIAVDPAANSAPTKTFDRYWWGLACTYVEHAQKRLGAWKVQERRRSLEIVYFADWRKEGDALHNRGQAGKLK
jgi:hypothetical protein